MQDGPGEAAVTSVVQESENPERVWNADMATTTALEIANLASAARASQVCLLSTHSAFQHKSLISDCISAVSSRRVET